MTGSEHAANGGDGQRAFPFLELPCEIRRLIYGYLFSDAVVNIRHRSREEFQAGNGGMYKVVLSKSYNPILTCSRVYNEARYQFIDSATFIYDSPFCTREITTICSRSMGLHVKRILDVSFLYFEDFRRMGDAFPNLELLGLVGHIVTRPSIRENELENLTRFFQRYLPKTPSQREMLDYFHSEARFQTFVSTAVTVTYFGDNSRDFERTLAVFLNVKTGAVTQAARGVEERREQLLKLFEKDKKAHSESSKRADACLNIVDVKSEG